MGEFFTAPRLLEIGFDTLSAVAGLFVVAMALLLAGDEILRCVARIMRESARADELIGRYGGEEFVLLVNQST